MAEQPTTIELISKITEFNDMSEYMNDPDLDTALEMIIKLITKPDIPSTKAPVLIVQLQAISAKFAMQARFYTSLSKDSNRKNIYYTAADTVDKLVDALKYSARFGA